jgi:hypothetical protein
MSNDGKKYYYDEAEKAKKKVEKKENELLEG